MILNPRAFTPHTLGRLRTLYAQPIIAVLHNTNTGRWHPIIYREAPLPGPYSPNDPVRHKSFGHHTEGFATREEALQSVDELSKKEGTYIGPVGLYTAHDIEWDGIDIPASVRFFDASEVTYPAEAQP